MSGEKAVNVKDGTPRFSLPMSLEVIVVVARLLYLIVSASGFFFP